MWVSVNIFEGSSLLPLYALAFVWTSALLGSEMETEGCKGSKGECEGAERAELALMHLTSSDSLSSFLRTSLGRGSVRPRPT